jgi:hypothetical protein
VQRLLVTKAKTYQDKQRDQLIKNAARVSKKLSKEKPIKNNGAKIFVKAWYRESKSGKPNAKDYNRRFLFIRKYKGEIQNGTKQQRLL